MLPFHEIATPSDLLAIGLLVFVINSMNWLALLYVLYRIKLAPGSH